MFCVVDFSSVLLSMFLSESKGSLVGSSMFFILCQPSGGCGGFDLISLLDHCNI